MASLLLDAKSGRFKIRFRFGGRSFKRTLKTGDDVEARSVLSRVEETIRMIDRGRLEMPFGADPAVFILSEGKLENKPQVPKVVSLDEVFKLHDNLPLGSKEPTTLLTEKIHKNHLRRILGSHTPIISLSVSNLQRYVGKRCKEKYHGRPIGCETISKEIRTFRAIWNWAKTHEIVTGPAPIKGIVLPKRDEKPPFMTRDEIQTIISRGGIENAEQKKLWDSLYLDHNQVAEVLNFVKTLDRNDFFYPLMVFVAHTGARRSEALRSRISDFDLRSRIVTIREKKKSREKSITHRIVPVSHLLCEVMADWFDRHPGGQFTLCELDGQPINESLVHGRFKTLFRASQWSVIKGFHVFRHSFASNLAAAGIDQRLIDEWMGHQTEEMRKRYRHLFPEQQRNAIDSVFGGNGK